MFLLVIPWSTSYRGGVSVVVECLGKQWRADGRPCLTIINDWSAAEFIEDEREPRFRFDIFGGTAESVASLFKSLINAPIQLAKTYSLLHRLRSTGVNFHYPSTNAFGVAFLKSLRLYRGKLVLSYHGTDVRRPKSWLERLQWRCIFAQADAITTCSAYLRERFLTEMKGPREKTFVAYNGVDQSLFNLRRELAPATTERKVLSLGSFIPRKGHRTLLHAFAAIHRGKPGGTRLIIAGGNGDELLPLNDLANELGISKFVEFRVDLPQAAVAELLQEVDLVVQPSRDEPFGLAVIEAAACGVPVVVSAVGGHLEIVKAGSTGWTFDIDDTEACCRAMEEALTNLSEARSRAMRLHAEVTRDFSWNRLSQQVGGYLS